MSRFPRRLVTRIEFTVENISHWIGLLSQRVFSKHITLDWWHSGYLQIKIASTGVDLDRGKRRQGVKVLREWWVEPSSSCGESESPSSCESESAEKEKDGSCLPAVKLAKEEDCKRCKSSERGMDLGADLASSGIAGNFHPDNFL